MKKHASQLNLRISPEELARVKCLAQSCNLTVSDLIRALIQLPQDAVDGNTRTLLVIDTKTHARLQREMRRWGYHYNQAVRAQNTIAYYLRRDKMDAVDVLEVLEDVRLHMADLDGAVAIMRRDVASITNSLIAWR